MKARKVVSHATLVLDVTAELVWFKPTTKLIKQASCENELRVSASSAHPLQRLRCLRHCIAY